MTTATEVFKAIVEQAEKIKSDATHRFPQAASFGDIWRQGDVYITLVESVPEGFTSSGVQPQLAPGTTKGSRHILDHSDVEMFRNETADALTGPVFRTGKDVTVTHPEHGDVICPPGIYAITYQRAFADELRRVAD